jgi:glutaconate CoA-transferase subunit B
VGKPSLAANLARRLHAPALVLIYESGPIGAKPTRIPLSIGDGELAATADLVVSVPEMFNYWLQPGRIDVGFLGAAEIDRFGNINTTVVGDYLHPKTRLPGAGGAPEIAANVGEVVVIVKHSKRALVDRVGFITSFGNGRGPGERAALGLRGKGPTTLITDLGILRPDPASAEFVLTEIHPGVEIDEVMAATGWPLLLAPGLTTTLAPTPGELTALRALETVR